MPDEPLELLRHFREGVAGGGDVFLGVLLLGDGRGDGIGLGRGRVADGAELVRAGEDAVVLVRDAVDP